MLAFLNQFVFGPVLPFFLMGCGLFFFVRLDGFLSPLHAFFAKRKSRKKEPLGDSPFRRAMLSLAGTLGVGNITGVATAIAMGGEGAVFWMWIAALASMPLRFAEITLSVRFRDPSGKPGPFGYLKNGIGRRFRPGTGKTCAVLLALVCLAASFSVGNWVQCHAAAEAMEGVFSFPPLLTGILLAFLTLLCLSGGSKRVGDMAQRLIPPLSVGYLILSLTLIVSKRALIPSVLSDIFHSAFSPRAAFGGSIGGLLRALLSSPALRYGTARGSLSHEAGCGTAPFAHGDSVLPPAVEGLWGLLEVFADTMVLCTMTAFALLLSPAGGEGTMAVIESFRAGLGTLGNAAACFLAGAVFCFAIASVICWGHYGTLCLSYLGFGQKGLKGYGVLFGCACIAGAMSAPSLIWGLSDASISLMTFLNTSCLCLLWREVKAELRTENEKKEKKVAKQKKICYNNGK